MAANFLEVQKQLEDMRDYKKELEHKLRQSEIAMEEVAANAEKEDAKKFVQLQKEKVNDFPVGRLPRPTGFCIFFKSSTIELSFFSRIR